MPILRWRRIQQEEHDEYLNIFSLNIKSLPKHGGELLHFLKDLNTRLDVIVLAEIGSKNILVVDKLIPDYNSTIYCQ